jgi:hypothetical protein
MKAKSCKELYIEEIISLSPQTDAEGVIFLNSLSLKQLEGLLKCIRNERKE